MLDGIDAELARATLDRVTDGVLIVGPDQAILYANQAAADLVGRDVDELVGAHTLLMFPVEGLVASIEPILERFQAGEPWLGRFTQRRPDGSVVDVDVTAWPWGDITVSATAIVVMRESTADRDRELAASREQHAAVLSVMGAVRPEPSVLDTTNALCAAIAEIDGFDGAMIVVRGPESDIIHVGNVGPQLPGMEFGATVRTENSDVMIAMSANGPWWLDMTADSTRELMGEALHQDLVNEGITASGYTPLWEGDRLAGVLCVANTQPDGPQRIPTLLPLLEQLGGFASMVLEKQALVFGEVSALRNRVRTIIDEQPFTTFLQPVVSMATGEVQGYEALTRFDDEQAPDLWLDDAHSVGLGLELEEACARSAVAAARSLPPDLWLCVNFSPEAIVGGSVGRSVLDAGRRVVIEVTEHTQVQSYAAIRDEMKTHPGIDISVDDAGAGFAGLRHILELDPTFVKLDISMVHDVDKDPSRAAMVAGMVHFARATGTRLVAEGIETEAEAEALRILGVDLGQGFHFSLPRRADEI